MLVHKINKICLCSNYIVKFLQMLFKKKKSNSKVKKKQEKKERDTFRNWDSTLKLTISHLPLLKMYTTINVIALAFFKNSRWKNGQFVFFSRVNVTAISHFFFLYIKQSKKTKQKTKPCRISAWNEVFPETPSRPNGWGAPLSHYVPIHEHYSHRLPCFNTIKIF